MWRFAGELRVLAGWLTTKDPAAKRRDRPVDSVVTSAYWASDTLQVSAPKLEHAFAVGSRLRRSWVGVEPICGGCSKTVGNFLTSLDSISWLAPEQVVELGGGVDAATYLVRCPRRDVVVKLDSSGLEAEARALRAWRPYTPRVPEVLALGTVPSVGERGTLPR